VDQRLTLVTLGVSDYARAKAFYEALGWSAPLEVEETAFFQGNGVIL
jgi:catechol 2,3-dioxygenase-like lactoylglutathione lyase family enzyme